MLGGLAEQPSTSRKYLLNTYCMQNSMCDLSLLCTVLYLCVCICIRLLDCASRRAKVGVRGGPELRFVPIIPDRRRPKDQGRGRPHRPAGGHIHGRPDRRGPEPSHREPMVVRAMV